MNMDSKFKVGDVVVVRDWRHFAPGYPSEFLASMDKRIGHTYRIRKAFTHLSRKEIVYKLETLDGEGIACYWRADWLKLRRGSDIFFEEW